MSRVDPLQTKTNKGAIPCKNATFTDAGTGRLNDDSLVFDSYTAIELRELSEGSATKDERHAELINLASCIQFREGTYVPNGVNILEFAKASGPLFGKKTTETVRSWLYASRVALLAVMLQEYLNDPARALGKLKANAGIQKDLITAPELGSQFYAYSLFFAADKEYADFFNQLPLIRRIETEEKIYYAFITAYGSEDAHIDIQVTVFAFTAEITNADFRTLRTLYQLDYDSAQEVQKKLKLKDIELQEDAEADAVGSLTEDTVVETEPQELDLDDIDPMRAILQALVVAHLFDASVDVFQGDASTGYLVFKNYLTWLWFDFSQKLSTVRIGYCQQCGRPFSLAGHRGLERHYCSERCKTMAKNERTKAETDEIRKLFKNGASTQEIAKQTGRPVAYIREQLSKWTKLKHELEEDIDENGFTDSDILRRCMSEKLDMERLLTKKKKADLREYLKTRG